MSRLDHRKITTCALLFIICVVRVGYKGFVNRALAQESSAVSSSLCACPLPADNDVAGLIVDLYCHPLGAEEIVHYEIPREHISKVLSYFRENKPDARADRGGLDVSEIGTIRANLKDGGCTRICWFMVAAKDRLHFSCAGRPYVHTGEWFAGDETLSFDAYIRGLVRTESDRQNAAPTKINAK